MNRPQKAHNFHICCVFFLCLPALIGKGEKWLKEATLKDSVKMELVPNQVCSQ